MQDADKYLDDFTIRDMLKRYSEFISFPIELWTEKTEYDTVPDPDAEVMPHPRTCRHGASHPHPFDLRLLRPSPHHLISLSFSSSMTHLVCRSYLLSRLKGGWLFSSGERGGGAAD